MTLLLAMDDWWTVQQAGWVGAGIGVLGGLFGTVLGGSTVFVQRGQAKRLILGGWRAMTVLGLLMLIAGITAVATQQPYHVFYPLLLGGSLFTLLGWMLGTAVRKQYQLVEARKVDAEQIRRG